MAIYRFKIQWEEDNDVERTILINSNQTFQDFFEILFKTFELIDNTSAASFYTSDDYWDKYKEITLKEEDIQSNELLMSNTKIASQVEQPHQKFIFVYDIELQLTFLIELVKIDKDMNEVLPKVISSKGKIPKMLKTKKQAKAQKMDTNKASSDTGDIDIDSLIYSSLGTKNISEDDILNGNLEEFFNELKTADKQREDISEELIDEEENEEENDLYGDEEHGVDEDDFKQNGYFDEFDN